MRASGLTVGLAILIAGGCNLVTGAGDLQIGSGEDSAGSVGDAGGTSSTAGVGGATSGNAGAGASSSHTSSSAGPGGGDGPIELPTGYADGATITDVDLYQAIRRPIVENGQLASSNIPIVARKPGLLRVFYTTDAGYDGQPVTARLTVGDEVVEVEQTLSGTSSHTNLDSTINIDVPLGMLAVNSDFKVELLQPAESVSGSNNNAAFPTDGGVAPLDAEQGAVKLKIKLVPVNNNGTLPDTSAEQVARYVRYFSEQYPVPEVEVTVRETAYTFNGSLGSYNGWSSLLDQISDLRASDNAPADVYYYGIHNANGNGLLGLGWVAGSNDVWSRTAIGVGWTGDTAPETAVHELGHNHGRPHSPCGVSGDGNYPHSGARIGVWGYRPSDKKLLDPSQYVDFMSYCDPAWMSDWNFIKIFDRAKLVSTQPLIQVPVELRDRSYDRIKVIDGAAFLQDTVTLAQPPLGQETSLTALIAGQLHTLTGHYYAYNHIDGGVLLVMRPIAPTVQNLYSQLTFSTAGRTFTVSR